MNDNYSKYVSTSDLALASVIALWYPLYAIDKTNPHKAVFLFIRNSDVEQIIESYWKRELKVEPQMYFSQLRLTKARLYESH